MRSLCAQPTAVVRASAAAPPARLRSAAPLHAALPAHRRRCVSLHAAARPVTVAAAVRAACAAALPVQPALTCRASCDPQAPPPLPFRVGHGFDLHRLAPGLKLILGGVDIPHTKGCEAHSDGERSGPRRQLCARAFLNGAHAPRMEPLRSSRRCAYSVFSAHASSQALRLSDAALTRSSTACACTGDVLIHCIVDSILGALGLPDIGAPRERRKLLRARRLSRPPAGQLFPDTDPTWKGASSDRFLIEAMRRMREAG